ncbi:MFS transporter [Chitiniphilus shinanonensis]|uniref:MFS transporter n=1 Tax=Chitiniphilus shinanonensis TaxID=553088 RepID=A0ABQ6BU49_9NEIS|nr:MFS transporter [Chitiniphilus shinanonensis]GLS03324.1 MFS transporter [Chitiniphilus shinanonensis]
MEQSKPGQGPFLAMMLACLPNGVMNFALPLYAHALGAGAVQVGICFTLASITQLLCRPAVGWWMDRGDKRVFLVLGCVLQGLAFWSYAASRQVSMLYLSAVVAAVANSLIWTAALALVAAQDRRVGEGMGRLESASARGALIGAIPAFNVVGMFSLEHSWPFIMAAFAMGAVVAALAAWRMVPRTPSGAQAAMPLPGPDRRRLHRLLALALLTALAGGMVLPVLMLYLSERFGAPSSTIAGAYIPAALVLSILPGHAGRLVDRLGSTRPLVAGLGLMAAAMLLMPWMTHLGWLIALWVVEACGMALVVPAERKLVAGICGARGGTVFGLYATVANAATAVGPLLGGAAYQYLDHRAPFAVAAALLGLTAALYLRWSGALGASAVLPVGAVSSSATN